MFVKPMTVPRTVAMATANPMATKKTMQSGCRYGTCCNPMNRAKRLQGRTLLQPRVAGKDPIATQYGTYCNPIIATQYGAYCNPINRAKPVAGTKPIATQ